MLDLRPASEGFPFRYRLKDAGEPGIACPTCGRAMRFVHVAHHGIRAMCNGADQADDVVGSHAYVFVDSDGQVMG